MSCVEVVIVNCETITVTLCEDNTQVTVSQASPNQVTITELVTNVTVTDNVITLSLDEVTSHTVIVNTTPISVVVSTAGVQGPQGPPGPTPTTVPRLTVTYDCLSSLAVGDFVIITATNFVSKVTDNLTATIPNGIFGVVYTKPSTITAEVMFIGVASGYSGLTAGDPVRISNTGTPTHAIPATGSGRILQEVGFAVSTTEFFLQKGSPIGR